jgi:hypothetical protein
MRCPLLGEISNIGWGLNPNIPAKSTAGNTCMRIVQLFGSRVEVPSGSSQFIFDIRNFFLQIHNVLVCFQIGICFNRNPESGKSTGKLFSASILSLISVAFIAFARAFVTAVSTPLSCFI